MSMCKEAIKSAQPYEYTISAVKKLPKNRKIFKNRALLSLHVG